MSGAAAPAPVPSRALPVLAIAALLLAAVVGSLAYGQVRIPLLEVLRAMLPGAPDTPAMAIVRELRAPRVLAAMLGGGALGIAGLQLQALLRNPLADPWSIGLTAGGQLGAALVVAGGGLAFASDAVGWLRLFADVGIVLGAAGGTLLVALAVGALARRLDHVTLLVLGLMLGFLAQGLTSVILHFANRSQGRIFSGWNDGTFTAVVGADLAILAAATTCGLLLAWHDRDRATALLLGELYAESLGVDVVAVRRRVLASVVLLSAPVTAYCGPVVFVGLIVPHLARLVLRTASIRALFGPTSLLGALLAVAADGVVHLPWQQHFLHLNAILALLGAPLVIVLLAGRRGSPA